MDGPCVAGIVSVQAEGTHLPRTAHSIVFLLFAHFAHPVAARRAAVAYIGGAGNAAGSAGLEAAAAVFRGDKNPGVRRTAGDALRSAVHFAFYVALMLLPAQRRSVDVGLRADVVVDARPMEPR